MLGDKIERNRTPLTVNCAVKKKKKNPDIGGTNKQQQMHKFRTRTKLEKIDENHRIFQ